MKMSLFGCMLFAFAFAFAFACMIDFNIEDDLVSDLFQVLIGCLSSADQCATVWKAIYH